PGLPAQGRHDGDARKLRLGHGGDALGTAWQRLLQHTLRSLDHGGRRDWANTDADAWTRGKWVTIVWQSGPRERLEPQRGADLRRSKKIFFGRSGRLPRGRF